MSTRKGNVARTRPQKYQNRSSFKNDLHDKTPKIKMLNSLQITGVCGHCKNIIDWKIKYKKYKPLTSPKKCVRCELKTVKHAYHVMCTPCGQKEKVCTKCCKKDEVVQSPSQSAMPNTELQQVLKSLPERKRRTLLRYLKKQSEAKLSGGNENDESKDTELDDLIMKLNMTDDDDCDDEDDLDSSDFSGSEKEETGEKHSGSFLE